MSTSVTLYDYRVKSKLLTLRSGPVVEGSVVPESRGSYCGSDSASLGLSFLIRKMGTTAIYQNFFQDPAQHQLPGGAAPKCSSVLLSSQLSPAHLPFWKWHHLQEVHSCPRPEAGSDSFTHYHSSDSLCTCPGLPVRGFSPPPGSMPRGCGEATGSAGLRMPHSTEGDVIKG